VGGGGIVLVVLWTMGENALICVYHFFCHPRAVLLSAPFTVIVFTFRYYPRVT
jgi:hypothetical protein